MHVLTITGPQADRATLEAVVDRTVNRLSQDGRVGVLRYDATIADGTTEATITHGGSVTYDLGADGDWTATGTDLTVSDALDSLTPTCAFAVVVGTTGLQCPTVHVGPTATDDEDRWLAAVSVASDLDVDALADALKETEPHETLESLVNRVKTAPQADRAGAIATFTGRVRTKDSADDAPTEYLEFEKYETVADQRIATLEADLEARDGVYAVELYHKTGIVDQGEDIVFVVVLAGHREEAFRTVEDGINRLKDEVPLFKKEVTIEEEFWVHDRS